MAVIGMEAVDVERIEVNGRPRSHKKRKMATTLRLRPSMLPSLLLVAAGEEVTAQGRDQRNAPASLACLQFHLSVSLVWCSFLKVHRR
jgi:hypothetical protein